MVLTYQHRSKRFCNNSCATKWKLKFGCLRMDLHRSEISKKAKARWDNIEYKERCSRGLKEYYNRHRIDREHRICKYCGSQFLCLPLSKQSFCSVRCNALHNISKIQRRRKTNGI